MDLFRFIPWYTEHIYEAGKEPLLFLFIAFLIAFACARGYTRTARRRGWGSGNVGGVHLHHIVPGIVMVLISGLLLATPIGTNSPFREIVCITFGVGAALVLDEFALIFHLEDVYWSNEGRSSVDAVILGAALGGILLVSSSPWGVDDDLARAYMPKAIIFGLFGAHILFATGSFLKGKLTTGMLGIFIPFVATIGALRLAKPGSPWAHRFYKGAKLARAEERYTTGRTARFENWWLDLIGGKPSASADGSRGAS